MEEKEKEEVSMDDAEEIVQGRAVFLENGITHLNLFTHALTCSDNRLSLEV